MENIKNSILAIIAGFLLITLLIVGCSKSNEIGEVNTKFNWFSANDTIVVEAFDDPDIPGVSCVLSRAKTGGMAGMVGVAEDTADGAIACVRTRAEIVVPEKILSGKANGDKIFKQSTSILFKSMQVVRNYDPERHIAAYLVYSDRIIEGSPNNSIAAVYLGTNN